MGKINSGDGGVIVVVLNYAILQQVEQALFNIIPTPFIQSIPLSVALTILIRSLMILTPPPEARDLTSSTPEFQQKGAQ